MEMYYLVLLLWSKPIIIPDKIISKEQCEIEGLASKEAYKCIKSPEYYNCMTSESIPGHLGSYRAIKTHCDINTGNLK
jgi:hypothetical protein